MSEHKYVANLGCPECEYWPVPVVITDPLCIDDPKCPSCQSTFMVAYDEGADNLRDMFYAVSLEIT